MVEILFSLVGIILSLIAILIYTLKHIRDKRNIKLGIKENHIQIKECNDLNEEVENFVSIQLVSIKKLKGSDKLGFETLDEVKERLSKLSVDEFKKLNIDYQNLLTYEELKDYDSRVNWLYNEASVLSILNPDKTINEEISDILCRKFKVDKDDIQLK